MAQETNYKTTGRQGGLDQDSAYEDIAPNDSPIRINIRNTGTRGQQLGKDTNIESNSPLSGALPTGINLIRGGGHFDDTGQILSFRYNSAGNCQMVLYSASTNTYQVVFTDVVDTDGETLLPMNPQNEIFAILINETYAIWWAKDLEVGYVNLPALAAGTYGTILWEDLSLLKPQCMPPPTGVYGSDLGQPANYLFSNEPQFSVQYVNADYNYSAWSTYSKRIVPYQENTPTLGSDVTQNNYIIVSVDAGSIRASVVNIARRFGNDAWYIIKSVDRTYITALPHTAVNVDTEITEAYNPTTNIYSFAYYNNTIAIPISSKETDLFYDYIWPSNSGALVNGNIAAIADWKTLYARPTTQMTVNAVGYDPNIDIPAGTYTNPFRTNGSFPGESGSGAGNHRRKMSVSFAGIPHTGDKIIVIIADIRNANNTLTYTYTTPSGQDGNQTAVVGSFSEQIPGSNFYDNGDGTSTINFVGPPYFGLQSFTIQLFFTGSAVANSIPSELDNSVYQLAISYRDYKSRPFPLCTGNSFIVNTPSYAQVNGNAIQLTWAIPALAPVGAVDYQLLTTKPPINTLLDVLSTPLSYSGTWDAYANSPTLSVNVGTVGDTKQITAPSDPSQIGHYTNLGNGASYPTGAYVTYNGQSWDVLPKSFGDLTTTGNILAFSLNPLTLFNAQYSDLGVDTILGYDFAVGDRCTLHYYINGSTNVYLNNPCVNLAVFGYDAGSGIVKVEKSATFDESILTGKNVFLRLYSPAPQTQAPSDTLNGTVWYEIGERFTITDGLHDTLSGVLHDGGVYYKTRQYDDALLPYANSPHQTLSTDLNYSDFYPSAFSSFGRPRTYYDVLEQTEQKANIITSQPYVLGSKNNGLTRFYPENIYGDSDGQISSSKGGIQVMWQRGQVLVTIQELGTFYIPVNEAYTVINDRLTGQSISSRLLNNGRYDTEGVGLGLTKCFCIRYGTGYGIDPNKSLPFKWTTGGIEPISGKMSKYFKSVINVAYSLGKVINMFYNDYYEEVVLTIQAEGGMLYLFPFRDGIWQPDNTYVIVGTDVTATPNGAHCTALYDSDTGIVTYTPTTDYVGSDSATFTFNIGSGAVTVNNCLNWTAGNSNVNPFSFLAQTGVTVNTVTSSNTILVGNPTIAVPISVIGGQYSVNGGAYTSSTGTVNNGDIIQVRQTSSVLNSTETDTTLTISGVSAIFRVTTAAPSINSFTFTPQTEVQLSTPVTSNTITIGGSSASPVPISIAGGTYSINGGAFTSSTGTISIGDTVAVKGTSSSSTQTTTMVSLTVLDKTGVFSISTYHTFSITINVTEGVNPYSDANVEAKLNGVEFGRLTGGGTYSYTLQSRLPLSIEGFSEAPATGANPTKTMSVIVNGTTVYGPTTNSNNPGDPSLLWNTYTPADNDVIVVNESAQATAFPADATGILVVDLYNDATLNVIGYINTVAATVPYQIPAYTGSNFVLTGSAPENCWVLASDAVVSGSLRRRFEFNIAQLMSLYPATTSFQMIVSGRSGSAGTLSGQYNLKGADAGKMIMTGSPGTYLPSTSGTTNIGITPYSGKAVVGGADGTYGIGVGAVILTFDYNVTTKTMTLT